MSDILDDLSGCSTSIDGVLGLVPLDTIKGAMAEIERLRQRATDLRTSNNEFEQRARDARANAKANNDALREIEPRWRELEHAMSALTKPRPISEYHEDMGDVLWWKFPIVEPPYVGSPNDLGFPIKIDGPVSQLVRTKQKQGPVFFYIGGWPGYHTHFTPIPPPEAP